MAKPHTTRIAPSPTGLFHLGSARTALFNYLAAKASGGRFILRIDDTDQSRHSEAAVQVIYDALKWLSLSYDDCITQSSRLGLYRDLANQMVSAGLARRDGSAVRLLGAGVPDFWEDTITGPITISDQDRSLIDGLVILRSDGMPTYHLASVVDDMDLGITWVIRGIDHMSNTAKHVALWGALSKLEWRGAGTAMPLWSHLGLITSAGKKISKRDGAASLLDYRDRGVNADALTNWLLRLGWGPTVDDKTTATALWGALSKLEWRGAGTAMPLWSHLGLITSAGKKISKRDGAASLLDYRDRAISLFLDGGKMKSSPANMDPKLLEALDRKYKGRLERTISGNRDEMKL